ncbi:alpha-glucosidase-like [Diachasmimorpha longicaudata]|uniref:alpha-glucosidase-like n=1 Tax=Diachasmimorpha longicaudata TaxID=58733 RepID=UPI0030B8D306
MFKITFLIGLFIIVSSAPSEEWWRDTFIYQVYPRSFKDSNGDGIGDINGITSKLEHLADLNVSAFWISPFFKSPMSDFGYDISNFTDIDPIFGTLDDFSKLITKAKSLNLKVILDFVPNHSSDQHPWFQKSIKRIVPYDNYYVWRNATYVNSTRRPPNNWLSVTRGSAWTWNEVRQQYYLHQFSFFQPDLNFRSSALNKEMKNALSFWTKRGVDGFRIDAIIHAFEDDRFLDEPVKPNTGLPANHPDTLDHIYTRNQNETYQLLRSWRNHLDAMNGTKKIILTESYTTLDELNHSMRYYEYGADIAFNFMFVTSFNNSSAPTDFKKGIEKWLALMPKGNYSSNWVVDNHDNNRVSARFGKIRADQLTMVAAVLPGVGVVYYGDEIGMEDTWLSYNETVDPIGCNAGPENYHITSRDPARTPFQWDSSTSAGFSTNKTTWLRVNSNYHTLNLAAQKTTPYSHYSIFKKLVKLKMMPVIKMGTVEIISIIDMVFVIVRRVPGTHPIVLLINFTDRNVSFDAANHLNIPTNMSVYATSSQNSYTDGMSINTSSLVLIPAVSVILM